MPCAGVECLCRWPDQSRWKSVILHEAGHQQSAFIVGAPGGVGTYDFACTGAECSTGRLLHGMLVDPPEVTDDRCACQHVAAANPLHCLQSAETYAAALDEGFGQFSAVRGTNRRLLPWTGEPDPDCTFVYYKEVLAPALLGPGRCGEGLTCTDYTTRGGPIAQSAYPPVPIDCVATSNWRDSVCGSTGKLAEFATELDFMQFFWNLHAQGNAAERLSMTDLYAVMRRACNVRDCTMGTTPDAAAEFAACLEQVCVGSDVLRWASIDAMTPAGYRSLNDGAESYFGGDLGRLTRFQDLAAVHGLTPPIVGTP